MSSSRPESAASMNPSDFATAPNTPGPATPLPDSFNPPVPTPQQSNTHLPEVEVQDTPEEAPQAPPASNTPTPRDVHTPLPAAADDGLLQPPRASYFATDVSTARDSVGPSSFDDSLQGLREKPTDTSVEEPTPPEKRSPIFKRPVFWLGVLIALIVLILVIVLPVYFTVVKKHNNLSSSATTSGGAPQSTGGPSNPGSPTGAITGGDGSIITTETGENFTYKNQFGGIWYADPNDPFNNNAQPNSWTPPLNTSWTWGKDKAYGVNLGGLFVLEPFITPALYQKYPGAKDEWTLSTLMAADTASGGLNQLEEHYNTFVTEQDIAEIAGAGLNWIRVPIPFWCIETWDGEPFLAKVSWKYIVRLFGWARKYGLRVNLDLHTIPGSQNGYNHSGKLGIINFLNGVMGVANAQRTLNYIRIITEFISQPEWQPVVPMFGMINEPLLNTIGRDQLTSFYLEVHNMMRNITGVGSGKGAYISIHDGFGGLSTWADFMPGSDRVILDTHPYFAFGGDPNTQPINTGTGSGAGGTWPKMACNAWASDINSSQKNFGVTVAGEFSAGYNDCGLFVKGVNVSATFGGNCDTWQDSSHWDAPTKAGVMAFTLASMDALQNWFFWTWKIGNSTAGRVESPLWSYQLGLENGWIPTDPRLSVGRCAALGVGSQPFGGTYSAWQTGGAGAGTIASSFVSQFSQWPPATISNADGAASLLPSYTSTGSVVTLPPPTLTASATHSISVGDGWFDTADTASGVTKVQGCSYPNAWSAVDAAVPTKCGGGNNAAVAVAIVTPPPKVRREER